MVAALTRPGISAVIPEASRPQPSRTPPIQIAMPPFICRQWAGETLNLLRVEPNINERDQIKGGMSSSPEIHGFSPGGFQYGVFRISVRIPIFAMARMSPRESHFLVVDVVRWAPNLHIFDSTHQDLTLHRECRSISEGITPYCLEK